MAVESARKLPGRTLALLVVMLGMLVVSYPRETGGSRGWPEGAVYAHLLTL